MSKKILSVAISAVMLVAMAIPASASVFTGSAETQPAPTVSEVSGTVGDYEVTADDITVAAMTDTAELSTEDQEVFDTALETVTEVTDIQDVVGTIDDMETPQVAAMFYVALSDELTEALAENPDAEISVTLTSSIEDGATVLAFVYKNDAWNQIDCVNNPDGTVTLTGHFCPVMLVVDTETVTSPDTNDVSANYFAAFAVVFVAASVACVASFRKSSKSN